MESPTEHSWSPPESALKPPIPTGVLCCTCIDSVLILVFFTVLNPLHLFMCRRS